MLTEAGESVTPLDAADDRAIRVWAARLPSLACSAWAGDGAGEATLRWTIGATGGRRSIVGVTR